MPRVLTEKEALTHGISTHHEQMDNGELRFRLIANDGSSCVRIQAPDSGRWQNSHFHEALSELYVVQKGWIVFVEYGRATGTCSFQKIQTGETCLSRADVPHNVYLTVDSAHYCVKFGALAANDWIAFPALDELTKHLSEEDIENMLCKGGTK